MPDLLSDDWKPRFRRFLLDLDSRLDSAVFHSGAWLREYYERFSTFMDRFHVSGWRRLSIECFSEAATLGTGGLLLLLALAIPAFNETSDARNGGSESPRQRGATPCTGLSGWPNSVLATCVPCADAAPSGRVTPGTSVSTWTRSAASLRHVRIA